MGSVYFYPSTTPIKWADQESLDKKPAGLLLLWKSPAGFLFLFFSLLLFHRLPFFKFPLSLLALVIRKNIGIDAPGNRFNAIFRDIRLFVLRAPHLLHAPFYESTGWACQVWPARSSPHLFCGSWVKFGYQKTTLSILMRGFKTVYFWLFKI